MHVTECKVEKKRLKADCVGEIKKWLQWTVLIQSQKDQPKENKDTFWGQ